MAKAIRKSKKLLAENPELAENGFDAEEYEKLFDLPEETKEQRTEKRRIIRKATKQRNRYSSIMKPSIWAERHIMLSEAYENTDDFSADYPEAKKRFDEARAEEKRLADEAAAQRRLRAQSRLRKKPY